jgi:integrase
MGSLYRRGRIFWAKYYVPGQRAPVRRSTGTANEKLAERLLKQWEGQAAEGRHVPPQADKVTVGELFDDLGAEYRANGRRSLRRLGFSLAHLRPVFAGRVAHHITGADVQAYVADRLEAGARPATVNRELGALRRAFRLGVEHGKIARAPVIRALREHNVRTGFFEREQFEAVRRHLPEALRPVVTFAYITGWRLQSEILPLQWRQVDFQAGTVRLEPDTTKNREGRVFVMTPELRAVLEAQRTATDALQRELGAVIPWVFHRRGRPIRDFRAAWRRACRAAGCPGRIPHDFRRTAVRNLERAGVSRSAAMKMTGHKTESVYRRYAIVSEADLHEAARKLAALDEAAGSRTGAAAVPAHRAHPRAQSAPEGRKGVS